MIEFNLFGYFISIKKTEDCLFSRRLGVNGVNFLGYNFYICRIWI